MAAAIIDPMRFTYHTAPPCARPCNTLQVYSVKVAAITGDLKWPLDVFGMVAVRDSVDRNRNLVFYRSRDICQTLTEKVCNVLLLYLLQFTVMVISYLRLLVTPIIHAYLSFSWEDILFSCHALFIYTYTFAREDLVNLYE